MNIKYMRTPLFTATLLSTALFLSSCGSQGRTDRMEAPTESGVNDLDIERAEVESDLLEIRTKLESRIQEVEDRMAAADLDDGARAGLIRFREDLQDRRNRIERARRDVDASQKDAWTDVRTATNNTVEDIQTWFDEQEDRLDSIGRNDEINDGMNKTDSIRQHQGDDNDGILQNGDIIDTDGVDD